MAVEKVETLPKTSKRVTRASACRAPRAPNAAQAVVVDSVWTLAARRRVGANRVNHHASFKAKRAAVLDQASLSYATIHRFRIDISVLAMPGRTEGRIVFRIDHASLVCVRLGSLRDIRIEEI